MKDKTGRFREIKRRGILSDSRYRLLMYEGHVTCRKCSGDTGFSLQQRKRKELKPVLGCE